MNIQNIKDKLSKVNWLSNAVFTMGITVFLHLILLTKNTLPSFIGGHCEAVETPFAWTSFFLLFLVACLLDMFPSIKNTKLGKTLSNHTFGRVAFIAFLIFVACGFYLNYYCL